MLPVLIQEANMAPSTDKIVITNEEENLLKALKIPAGLVLTMVLKAAIELGLFEIIEKSSQISSYEIASHLPTKNPKAPLILERILMFLASESLLTCNIIKDDNGCNKRLYSLTPLSIHYLVSTKDGESLAPLLQLATDQIIVNSWCHLKDTILEGETPFKKVHGMHMFEYLKKDSRFDKVFNKAMQHVTCLGMQKILEHYDGLQGVKQVVDVGGGLGVSLASILYKYPHIKGVNFDLPHVIKDAPTYAGVKHVGGDMFESVPQGEVILVKRILHNWDDDNCLKILKNCWRALPEDGKVVVIEEIKEEYPVDNLISKHTSTTDMIMMNFLAGGKERTKQEFEALAKEAGFATMKIVSRACCDWVIELYKR